MAPVPRAQFTREQQRREREEVHRKAAEDALLASQETLTAIEDRLRELGALDTSLADPLSSGEVLTEDVSQRDRLEGMVADLGRQLKRREELIAALSEEIDAARTAAKSRSRSDKSYRRRVEQLAGDVAIYKEKTSILESRVHRLESRLRDLDAALAEERRRGEVARAERDEAEAVRDTGWVAAADVKTLRRNKILVGGALRRKTPDCSACPECFRPIDVSKETTFVVHASRTKVKVWSLGHPPGSFVIESSGPHETVIRVRTPSEFWRYSKCLIIGY